MQQAIELSGVYVTEREEPIIRNLINDALDSLRAESDDDNPTYTQQFLKHNPEKLSEFDRVRIWSSERSAWWCSNGIGYTTDIKEAGVYDIDNAWYRVENHGAEKCIVLEGV